MIERGFFALVNGFFGRLNCYEEKITMALSSDDVKQRIQEAAAITSRDTIAEDEAKKL